MAIRSQGPVSWHPVRRTFAWLALIALLAVIGWRVTEYRAEVRPRPTVAASAETSVAAGASKSASSTPKAAVGKTVVVIAEGLNLREAARGDAKVLGRLKKGTRLRYLGASIGWYHVRTAKGLEGWVAAGGGYSRVE